MYGFIIGETESQKPSGRLDDLLTTELAKVATYSWKGLAIL